MESSDTMNPKLAVGRLATADTASSTASILSLVSSKDSDDSQASFWSSPPQYEYTFTTHYYCTTSSNQRFEQSLDVYQPQNVTTTNKGVVVMVVGSGWMGHQPYVYWGTSWWNSSLPKQISTMGYTCIVIRHSGGFPRIHLLAKSSWTSLLTLLLVVHLVVFSLLNWCWDCEDKDNSLHNQMILATFVTLFFYIFWYWQGQGAATLDDMLNDVSTALKFIDEHLPQWTDRSSDNRLKNRSKGKIQIIFGGYSSGAHVAATLLSSEKLSPLAKQNTLSNVDICHVLYLSGFLHVSPSSLITTLLTVCILGQWPSTIPSPLQAIKDRPQQSKSHPVNKLPPHTLLGCKYEVFGLPILDSAFCSVAYTNILNQQQPNSAECTLLQEWTCNHWSALSTMSLRKVLYSSLEKAYAAIKS
ncbi:hypothetical protein IV203_011541 [Nitzschia inconspicua]|uniref:Uncharacterized protein n=1 Tax=Nitzschia inconspicua TaxID=303405 RepID=A0A9K3PL42_9STRA|nr:hypothetical protein IV203_011541 [Nitzschia inconspicua]